MNPRLPFPNNIIVKLTPYREVFFNRISGATPREQDFQELMQQLMNGVLNYSRKVVMRQVGITIPDPNLMRDTSFETNLLRFNELTIASADIVAMLCNFFTKIGAIADDGTVPYRPVTMDQHVMVLRFVKD